MESKIQTIGSMAALLCARYRGPLDAANRVQEAVKLYTEVEKQLATGQQEGR